MSRLKSPEIYPSFFRLIPACFFGLKRIIKIIYIRKTMLCLSLPVSELRWYCHEVKKCVSLR